MRLKAKGMGKKTWAWVTDGDKDGIVHHKRQPFQGGSVRARALREENRIAKETARPSL